jgi:C1A family cysteine protease
MKSAIANYGPIVVTLAVYDDFYWYGGGVYHHTWGGLVGLHAVLAVGYNDVGGYFIVKNSWGTGWGAGGYFKISYDEVDAQRFGWGWCK